MSPVFNATSLPRLIVAANQDYALAAAPHWVDGIAVLNTVVKSHYARVVWLFLYLVSPVMGDRAGGAERLAGFRAGTATSVRSLTRLQSRERLKNRSRSTIMNAQSPVTGEFCPHVAIINGTIKTTSLKIAEHFGKRHDDVLKRIKSLDCSPEFHARNFAEMIIEIEIGKGATRKSPAYEITRDGFMFLAMGFTGVKAAQWKEAYINAFNRMEIQLLEKTEPLPKEPPKQIVPLIPALLILTIRYRLAPSLVNTHHLRRICC